MYFEARKHVQQQDANKRSPKDCSLSQRYNPTNRSMSAHTHSFFHRANKANRVFAQATKNLGPAHNKDFQATKAFSRSQQGLSLLFHSTTQAARKAKLSPPLRCQNLSGLQHLCWHSVHVSLQCWDYHPFSAEGSWFCDRLSWFSCA